MLAEFGEGEATILDLEANSGSVFPRKVSLIFLQEFRVCPGPGCGERIIHQCHEVRSCEILTKWKFKKL